MDACKAVIVDLDGTLLNTLDDIGLSVNRMLRARGLPEHGTDAYRFFVGDSGVDVQTALAAGMQAFGAAWGFRGKPELLKNGCTVLLDHPVDLLKFIS